MRTVPSVCKMVKIANIVHSPSVTWLSSAEEALLLTFNVCLNDDPATRRTVHRGGYSQRPGTSGMSFAGAEDRHANELLGLSGVPYLYAFEQSGRTCPTLSWFQEPGRCQRSLTLDRTVC